ncbi:MAG: RIC1-domain-containing protein [Monoraphidium minutum]|nr:MAG: RIC1-domain-containing protein [Monoraphidium minutum]
MLFPFGWPTRLQTVTSPQETYIFLHADQEYVIAATELSVQVWSGAAARVRLGQVHLSRDDVQTFGTHTAACWSPERARLAVLTSHSHLIIYAIHIAPPPLLPIHVLGAPAGPSARAAGAANNAPARGGGGGAFLGDPRELAPVAIFAREAAILPHSAPAAAICCDARTLGVAFADGCMVALSWGAKLKSQLVDPLAEAFEPSEDGEGAPEAQPQGRCGVARLEFSPSLGALVAVLDDGSAALCRTPEAGLHPLDALEFSHWLCGPGAGAVCAALAPPLGLVALGCATGEVLLVRLDAPPPPPAILDAGAAAPGGRSGGGGATPRGALSPAPTPFATRAEQQRAVSSGGFGAPPPPPAGAALLRSLHLGDWGHSVAQTGGAAAVAWAPDYRAVAVGYARQGAVVWSVSGCRLMCTVRQPEAARTPRASQLCAPGPGGGGGGGAAPLAGGVQSLAWGVLGYSLIVACAGGGAGGGGAAGGAARLPERAARLLATAAGGGGAAAEVYEVAFAKSLGGNHRVAQVVVGGGGGAGEPRGELHMLQAADRLLLISEAAPLSRPLWHATSDALRTSIAGPEDAAAAAAAAAGGGGGAGSDLGVVHVPLPAGYAAANWPLVHAAASAAGGDVAVSGRRGLALYCRRAERWRLFGDERRVSCAALGWVGSHVVACSAPGWDAVHCATSQWALAHAGGGAAAAANGLSTRGSLASGGGGGEGGGGGGGGKAKGEGGGCQILVFPKKHLDFSSLVASYDLTRVPMGMDCAGQHVIVASPPLDILLLRLDAPAGRLEPVRTLSIYNTGRPLQSLALVLPPPAAAPLRRRRSSAAGDADLERAAAHGAAAAAAAPRQAVLLRRGGALSVLDLDLGTELLLSEEIECFWLSSRLPVGGGPGASRAGSTALPSRAGSAAAAHALSHAHGHASRGPLAAAGPAAAAGGALALLEAIDAAVVELPWWCYGASGMLLWFASLLPPPPPPTSPPGGGAGSGAPPPRAALGSGGGLAARQGSGGLAPSPSIAAAAAAVAAANTGGTDIELEFDREVYPIGVSLADASIVGVTQRLMRVPLGAGDPSQGGEPPLAMPCFHPAPESQPVLPALLRRLLLKGASAEALALAKRHEAGPHFARSLEWLLFTALDLEGPARRRDPAPRAGALGPLNKAWPGHASGLAPQPIQISRLMGAAADLVLSFPPRSYEVAVSVARKTDAALWPALFTAVGSPAALLQHLIEQGALMSAACFLIVVDRLEGPQQAQGLALRLVRLALRRAQYGLCAEILRFMMPPGFQLGGPAARAAQRRQRQEQGRQQQQQAQEQQQQQAAADAKAARFGCMPAPAGAKAAAAPDAAQGGAGAPQQGRAWLGWLWGGSPAGAPGAAPPPGGAPLLGTERSAGGDSACSEGGGGGGGGSPRRSRLSGPGAYRRSLGAAPGGGSGGGAGGAAGGGGAGSGGSGGSAGGGAFGGSMWEGVSSGGAGGAEEACHLGKHSQLARLIEAMAFLPSGLSGLMAAYRDTYAAPASPAAPGAAAPGAAGGAAEGGAWWAAGGAAPGAGELVEAVVEVVGELPVWEGPAVEEDAAAVMALARALGAAKWGVALGVLLVDTAVLSPFAAAHPATWRDLCAALASEPSLHYMGELVAALSMLPGGGAPPGRPHAGPRGGGGGGGGLVLSAGGAPQLVSELSAGAGGGGGTGGGGGAQQRGGAGAWPAAAQLGG